MIRTRWLLFASAAVAALAVAAFGGRGAEVTVAPATRGAISEWVEGTGKARVRERYVVLAPVTGDLERVEVRAGDRVCTGDPVARVLPLPPFPLDARARAEAEARAAAAAAAEGEARARLLAAELSERNASRELARARALRSGEALAEREFEAAEVAAQTAAAELRAARAAVERARGERAAAQAVLTPPTGRRPEAIAIGSPADGVVLRLFRESAGPVQAGAAIAEVGDPLALEVALELLTEQSSRVCEGAAVELYGTGGPEPLAGVVRRVEPSAFTKVSALGVEEQRVLVIVEPAGGRDAWAHLGDGWRVEGRVVVEERADAVKIPASAVFKDRGWAVYVVEDGRARRRDVRVGVASGAEVEVVSGLREGERVVVDPSTEISDGARVRVR